MNVSACLLVLLRLSNAASAYNFKVTEGGEVSGRKTYTVTKVTDVKGDDSTSTFRGAINAAIKDRKENGKPAVIRFDIPCTGPFIELSRELKIDGAQDLTIDGSDQPGGVTIANFQVASNLSKNLVLRHLRFRPGRKTIDDENNTKNKCKPDVKCSTGNDALYIQTCEDCLVEHCSFGLATDEALSIEASRKVIVRKNIMGPGITAGGTTHFERNNCTDDCTEEPCDCNDRTKSYHNFGSLWNANDDLVAHDNIWSGFNDRCPQLVTRSACCDDDGKPNKKLEDPNEDCPDGYTYCLGQNSKPSLYLYNNVIARCMKGTSFKAYRGDINVWKNVYLNDNSGELDKSLYSNKGNHVKCSRFQSRKHIFEDKYGDVDDNTSKKAFKNQAFCDAECSGTCGDDPDEDGFGDSSPQSALEEAIEDEAWGAHPLDEFDQLIIDSIKNDGDLPRYTGYYPNIRKGKRPSGGAKVAIKDNTDNGCKAVRRG